MPHAPSKPEQSQPRTSAPSAATTAPSAEEYLKTQQQPPYPRHAETPAPAPVQTPHDDQPLVTRPARYAPAADIAPHQDPAAPHQDPAQHRGSAPAHHSSKPAARTYELHNERSPETRPLIHPETDQPLTACEKLPGMYPGTHPPHIRTGHTLQAHT